MCLTKQFLQQGPVPVSTTRRSSNDSAAVKAAQSLPPGAKAVFAMNASPQIKELLDSALLWDFNIFRLEDLTSKRYKVNAQFNRFYTLMCMWESKSDWVKEVVEKNFSD